MNHYKTEPNGTLIDTTPLFASVWLALYYELRKNTNERRLAAAEIADCSQAIEK